MTRGSYCERHQPKKPPSPSSRVWRKPGSGKLRQEALERDGHTCRRCGSTSDLEVHHLHGPELHSIEFLITLCRDCHREAEKGVRMGSLIFRKQP